MTITHGLFACFFGAWMSETLLLLVTSNQWIGVFGVSICLGLCVLENWDLYDELNRMNDELVQHGKQITGMQYIIQKTTSRVSEMKVEHTREKFRSIVHDKQYPLKMNSPCLGF
jgi:dolichyl-phosphate-mannose--protein O-mannosyl transferase